MRFGNGRVHDHDDVVEGMVREERLHGLVELRERRIAAAFGRDVRPVDHQMGFGHDVFK